MSRIICCSAHKGGVGKTVTSMALAAAYARAGEPTLLVDVDPQGHSTIGLGVEVEDGGLTVRDVFGEPAVEAARAVYGTATPNLSVLPATIRLERIAHQLYLRPRRELVLAKALKPLRSMFKWIVIDCPPSLGALTQAAVTAADLVLVPCRMEARAGDGLVDLLELLAVLKSESFGHWRILLTQVDRRKSNTNAAVAAMLEPWQTNILECQIPQSEPLNQAQIARVDCFAFDHKCAGSIAYAALAADLRELPQWHQRLAVASSI